MNSTLLVLASTLLFQGTLLTDDDAAAKRLEDLLRRDAPIGGLTQFPPHVFAEPGRLANPPAFVPRFDGQPPRPDTVPTRVVRPLSPDEPSPLQLYFGWPTPPQVIELPTTVLVAWPSLDISKPAPLPVLAKPTNDRASLADVTMEASIAAALAASIPLSLKAVPFAPLNLPDPFELQQLIRLTNPPPDNAPPMAMPGRILIKTLPIPQPMPK